MDPKNQILQLPDKRYPSKRDFWLTALLLGVSAGFDSALPAADSKKAQLVSWLYRWNK